MSTSPESTPLLEDDPSTDLPMPLMEGYPSTDLSKQLLKNLQDEFKGYKRYKKSSGAIFLQSHVVYEGIIGLVKKISNEKDTIHWDDYMKSAQGITGLEAHLLELLFNGHDQDATLPKLKLQESVQWVETWHTHHEEVVATTQKLDEWVFETVKLLPEGQRKDFRNVMVKATREDDAGTVASIVENLKENPLKDSELIGEENERKPYVTDVKGIVEAISIEVKNLMEKLEYPEDCVGRVVSGVMLIHIPFVVSQVDSVDAKTDEHLKSVKLWEHAKTFAEYMRDFLKNSSDKKDELKEKYAAFKKKLEEVLDIGPLTAQILTMMHLSAQVRRPFYGRSVSLVKMWYTLNRQDSLKNEGNRGARASLRKALEESLRALKSAKEIAAFDPSLDGNIGTVEGFYSSLLTNVTSLVEKYAAAEKDALDKEYEEAAKVDKDHLARFRAKTSFLKAGDNRRQIEIGSA